MSNIVTSQEVYDAKRKLALMSSSEIRLLEEAMAEQAFNIRAAFGPEYGPGVGVIEETGVQVSSILAEMCYRARVDKLFEERDRLLNVLEEHGISNQN